MLENMNTRPVHLRVSELLKQRKMSRYALAKKTGMHIGTISLMARDAYERIGLNTIGLLCKALGVMPGELFSYNPNGEEHGDR